MPIVDPTDTSLLSYLDSAGIISVIYHMVHTTTPCMPPCQSYWYIMHQRVTWIPCVTSTILLIYHSLLLWDILMCTAGILCDTSHGGKQASTLPCRIRLIHHLLGHSGDISRYVRCPACPLNDPTNTSARYHGGQVHPGDISWYVWSLTCPLNNPSDGSLLPLDVLGPGLELWIVT